MVIFSSMPTTLSRKPSLVIIVIEGILFAAAIPLTYLTLLPSVLGSPLGIL